MLSNLKMSKMNELVLCEGLRIDFKSKYNQDIFKEYGKLYPQQKGTPTSHQLADFSAAKETEETNEIENLFTEWQEPMVNFGSSDEDTPGRAIP